VEPILNKKPKVIKKNQPKSNNKENGFEDFVFEEPNFNELLEIELKNQQKDEVFWKFYDQKIAES
jgi:hypothetical protein